MKNFNKLKFEEQAEAMHIILNIQTMQQKVYNKYFEFAEFEDNTIDELRKLQEIAIQEYNSHILNTK